MNGHIQGSTWAAIHAYAIMYEIPSKYPKRITNSKIDPHINTDRTYTRAYEEGKTCRNFLLRAQFKKKKYSYLC